MNLKDAEGSSFTVKPIYIDGQCFLCLGKDGHQIGSPDLDPNTIISLIQELKQTLLDMVER